MHPWRMSWAIRRCSVVILAVGLVDSLVEETIRMTINVELAKDWAIRAHGIMVSPALIGWSNRTILPKLNMIQQTC